MTAPGEFALVLHTHLPYVEHHGVWPVGEEWLFQAWGTSWLAVTDVLVRLADRGHRDVLTLSVSPVAAEQLASPRLRRDLGTWLAGQMWLAEEQRGRYAGRERRAVRELGPFFWRHHARLLRAHDEAEAAGGLLRVWRDLADRGVIQLLGGPATHPYLPLLADRRLLDAQLACGLASQTRWAGRRPTGLWAPECGYRPGGPVGDPTAEPLGVDVLGTPSLRPSQVELPGLEEVYAHHGITHTVIDTPSVVDALGGPERDWTRRPAPSELGPAEDLVRDGVLIGDSEVAAFVRDLSVTYHVWSPHTGYPGDPWYRDFHARSGLGTHPSWRVTGKDVAAEAKAVYEPGAARERVEAHAEHLHDVLRTVLDTRPGGLVVAAYDTELFGHWWFEGPDWLERLLGRVGDDPRLRTTTLASRLERRPPRRRLRLPESSWGYGKGHASWVSPATRWMWQEQRDAEARFRAAVDAAGPSHALAALEGAGLKQRSGSPALQQAARELAMVQASDWSFMVNRGGSPGYAQDRFRGHVARLHQLLDVIEEGDREAQESLAQRLAEEVGVPRDPSPFVASPAVTIVATASRGR